MFIILYDLIVQHPSISIRLFNTLDSVNINSKINPKNITIIDNPMKLFVKAKLHETFITGKKTI